MNIFYKKQRNIRGTRYDVILVKTCKGMPGFAPIEYDKEVGRVCVKFLEGEAPFIQFFDEPPILEISEVEQMLEVMKRGYVESDFEQLSS